MSAIVEEEDTKPDATAGGVRGVRDILVLDRTDSDPEMMP
jgi:hypothetical protein